LIFSLSVLQLLGLDLPVPDHSTLSRRAETLEVLRPKASSEPVHLLVDSTGLKLCGPGEWLIEKHGSKRRRGWRKLHLATDADTGRIVAAVLTDKDADDGSQVGPLLEQVEEPVASFTGDGAYNRDDVYTEVTTRHPDAAVIVPPRASAVPSAPAETAPTQRDCHLQCIAERGRMGWQRASGYNDRALVEAARLLPCRDRSEKLQRNPLSLSALPPSDFSTRFQSSTLALLRDVKPRRTSARPNAAVGALDFPRFVRAPANSDNRPATGSGSPPPLPRAPV